MTLMVVVVVIMIALWVGSIVYSIVTGQGSGPG